MSSERRRDRRDGRNRDDGDEAGEGQGSRQRQRRDDDRHGGDGGGGRRGSYEDSDRRRHHQGNASTISSGLKKDRDADEGLTFETSPGIVAIKSFEKMGLRVSLVERKRARKWREK